MGVTTRRMNRDILGVIPARGGSKRIPGKNLKEISGKPLIAHTIEQAQKSHLLTRTIVSTDDSSIKETALEYGGDVPFNRPAELATDTAKTREVVTHAIDWLEARDEEFDIVCKLQPTNPLRIADDIDESIRRLVSFDAQSVISVNSYLFPPDWALTEDEGGYLTEHFHDGYLWEGRTRSQDSAELYCPNGAVMAATIPAWKEYQTFYTSETVAYTMPPTRSFDIDEPPDLELVKHLMETGFDGG